MIDVLSTGMTLPDAYHKSLTDLFMHGRISDCPDWNTTQKEISCTLKVYKPLQEPRISRCFPGGARDLQKYVMEICDGIEDFEVDAGKWEYTYHSRMGSQIDKVVEELKRNPYSRRAVITIRQPSDIEMSDPPCLQHIQYFIRDRHFDCCVLFRSNDAVQAAFMNAYALIELQKRIADRLGVEMGTYTHRANSYHCYEKNFSLLKAYAERIRFRPWDCTYDNWDEEMAEEIPAILGEVELLKRRTINDL